MNRQKPDESAIDTIQVGQHTLFKKTVSGTDIMLYAGLSGDFSPLYMDEVFAAETIFSSRTVHPMLLFSMAGGAIHRLLPLGVDTISRSFQTVTPVFVNETVTVIAEVKSIDRGQKQVTLSIHCYNQKDDLVMKGTSIEYLGFSGTTIRNDTKR